MSVALVAGTRKITLSTYMALNFMRLAWPSGHAPQEDLSQGCNSAPTCALSLPLRFCMSATMAVVRAGLSGLQLKAMGGSFPAARYLYPPDPHRNALRGP